MSYSNIIPLFPTNTPTPPKPTLSFVLRILRRIIAIWKTAMAKEYSGAGRLPLIIPSDWSVDRVLHFINGGKHEPVFVATITRKTVRRNTMAEWGLVA